MAAREIRHAGQSRPGGARAADECRCQGDRQQAVSGAELRQSGDAELLSRMLLHEDEKVFVLNKPSGLAVQGGSGVARHIDKMLEAWTNRKGEKPRLVHRLDRDTSGVLVVARSRSAAQSLAEAFRQRETKKTYWALVKGVPRPAEGKVSTYLVKEQTPDGDRMRIAKHGEDGAEHALSYYRVIEQAGQNLAGWRWSPIPAAPTSCASMRSISAIRSSAIRNISESRPELGISGRHAEAAASARPPHRYSPSLGRPAEGDCADAAAHGAKLEPARFRRGQWRPFHRMKLVLFDCDGTLVDSGKLIHEVMARTFLAFGEPRPEPHQTHAIIGLTLDVAIARMLGEHHVDDRIRAMTAHYKDIYSDVREEPGFRKPL